MIDQAQKLRKMVINNKINNKKKVIKKSIKVYSIVSGKGGVGKTNITVNLGITLQNYGKKILIIDADLGMANVDVILGLNAEHNFYDYIKGRVPLRDIIIEGPNNIKIIPGGSGLLEFRKLNSEKQQKFQEELLELEDIDIILIDNGGGISLDTLTFVTFSHEIILVTTPEPTALTDAYCILKAISNYKLKDSVKLIVNQTSSIDLAEQTFEKLYKTSKQFLNINIEMLGYIFNDNRVSKSVMEQNPFILEYPNCLAAKNIVSIGKQVLGDRNYYYNTSNIDQFFNRFIKIFG